MKLSEKIGQNEYLKRFRQDYEFRTLVTTLFSSVLTAAIGAYNLALGCLSENGVWLFTIAAYYFALALARIAVLVSHRLGMRESERRQRIRSVLDYLFGGLLLVVLTLTYSGIIVLVVVKQQHFTYRGNMIYVMALYAFYKIISSAVNVVKYKKYGDFTVQTFRNINLADGIVSIIALQSAMLFAFSGEDVRFASAMNAGIGGLAGAVILVLGVYMVIRACRTLCAMHKEIPKK